MSANGWEPIETLPPMRRAFVGRWNHAGDGSSARWWTQAEGHWFLFQGEVNWAFPGADPFYGEKPTHWHPALVPPEAD